MHQNFNCVPRSILNSNSWMQRFADRHSEDSCYAYPHHRIYIGSRGTFEQTRSGPNWLATPVTMTTCKHRMRSFNNDWSRKIWLAGFTNTLEGHNWLLYLARVGKTFESQSDLFYWYKHERPNLYQRKLAHFNPLGDIYQPKRPLRGEDRFVPRNYIYPKGHCREVEFYKDGTPKWHRDINYIGAGGRRPLLFVYDRVVLFNKPQIFALRNLGRSGYKTTVSKLWGYELEHTE